MPQGTSFTCSDCAQRIEDSSSPLIAYLVVGLAPLHPITKAGEYTPEEVAAFPMPDIMRATFSGQVQRVDFCSGCLAKALGHPITDAQGRELASPEKAEAFMAAWTPPESGVAKEARERAEAAEAAAKAQDQPAVEAPVPG